MFWRSKAWKPAAEARTKYLPAFKLGARYSPAPSVTKFRATPVSVFVTVTMAPTITPPVWSVTVPRMRPVLTWENSGNPKRSTAEPKPATTRIALLKITHAAKRATRLRNFIGSPHQHIFGSEKARERIFHVLSHVKDDLEMQIEEACEMTLFRGSRPYAGDQSGLSVPDRCANRPSRESGHWEARLEEHARPDCRS